MKQLSLPLLLIIILSSCQTSETTNTSEITEPEWTSLLINNSLEGWHIFQDDGEKKGWIVEDNILIFNGLSDMESGEGDASLLSDKMYESFEIQFEWKVEAGGNSGFMWGVREDAKYNYPYQTGQEIQILDPAIYDDPSIIQGGEIEVQNAAVDLEARKHFVGALYDLSAPSVLDACKPADQWNAYNISINYAANLGKVMLNGVLVNSFPLKGPKWDAMYQESKFSRSEEFDYLGDARWHDFAAFSKGSICFQDHPGRASFRNIKVRELE